MAEFNEFSWDGITYPPEYMHRLFDYARARQPKRILEVGLDQGASALAFLRACPDARMVSIDIADCAQAIGRLERAGVRDRLEFIKADSRDFLREYLGEFDLIYIDGDHLYDAVRQDIENCARILSSDGVMIADDADPAHTHFGVYRAVTEFCVKEGWHMQPIEGSSSYQVIISRV